MTHEDVNGEKLTAKKWWIFGADFSRFMQSFSRFIRDKNGEKKKSRVIDMIFFTVSFSRFAPQNFFRSPRSYPGKTICALWTPKTLHINIWPLACRLGDCPVTGGSPVQKTYVSVPFSFPALLTHARNFSTPLRSGVAPANQSKGQNEKLMNFAHFFVNSGVCPQENKHDSH